MKPQLTEPLPPQEFGIIRGLIVSPAACRWVEDMGIPITVLRDRRARALAQWAMTRNCEGAPQPVEDALRKADPGAASILDWIRGDLGADFKPEWGTRDVLRYCRELYPRWFPGLLRDMAAQVEQSDVNAQGALEHLGRVVEFLTGGEA